MRNRNNYQWRPNDNSSQTKIRYKLEAEHWLNAFHSATVTTSGGLTELFGIIGIVASIFINLIYFIVYGTHALYRLFFPKKFVIIKDPNRTPKCRMTLKEINEYRAKLVEKYSKIPEWAAYQEKLKNDEPPV